MTCNERVKWVWNPGPWILEEGPRILEEYKAEVFLHSLGRATGDNCVMEVTEKKLVEESTC